jgi:uncharacterized repeat protein (TIGR03803 family)
MKTIPANAASSLRVAAMTISLALSICMHLNAQTYSVLYSFGGGPDGEDPNGGMIVDDAGNLYGTTWAGGGGPCLYGCGTFFKLDPTGTKTILYNFDGTHGGGPLGGLIRDRYGNFYGVTFSYGLYGHGVVFKIDPSGNETDLYNFMGAPDGQYPVSTLALDAAGNVYGTTVFGGTSNACSGGCGTVFKIDPSGNETVLHNFTGGTDGEYPYAGVVLGPGGNLFGATTLGGTGNCYLKGCGTVFKIDANGTETVFHSFSWGIEGAFPYGNLIRDAAGNLYGTTLNRGGSGCRIGCGAVFKLDPTGKETVLHAFSGDSTDGQNPYSGVIADPAGNLYGTTENHEGSVFELSPNGAETILHFFGIGPDAADPMGDLVRDKSDNLYGAGTFGGQHLYGAIFKIAP